MENVPINQKKNSEDESHIGNCNEVERDFITKHLKSQYNKFCAVRTIIKIVATLSHYKYLNGHKISIIKGIKMFKGYINSKPQSTVLTSTMFNCPC